MKQLRVFFYLLLFGATTAGAANEQIYKGFYTWGPEVHSFKPCSKNIEYWVSFDWAGIAMHKFYKANKTTPYQVMYIEFRGQVLNEKVDGFARDYSGLIRISEINKYSFDIPSDCKVI